MFHYILGKILRQILEQFTKKGRKNPPFFHDFNILFPFVSIEYIVNVARQFYHIDFFKVT